MPIKIVSVLYVCVCQCYSFCCCSFVFFFCSVRLMDTIAAAAVVAFVICWIQCVIVTFEFRLCHRKLNTKPNWFNCVLRMRNAKTDSFSVFRRHHPAFGLYLCVLVWWCVLCLPTGLSKILSFSSFSHMCDCQCISRSLSFYLGARVYVLPLFSALSLLFACKNRCVQIDRRQSSHERIYKNSADTEYISVFC